MSLTVNNELGQLLCYDETNPMVFHDELTAIHWIQQNLYKGLNVTEEELWSKLTFNDMGILYKDKKPETNTE